MVYSRIQASVLFGVEGLQVTDAQAGPDGTLGLGRSHFSGRGGVPGLRDRLGPPGHDTVLARPRDVRRGGDRVAVTSVKRRWKCDGEACCRKTFTEWLPQVPPRCRITARLREQAGAEVSDRGITPAEAARHAGISWPVAHEAFAAAAAPVLEQALARVAHLGIDEAGQEAGPRWERDGQTGEYALLADRWHTCFFDLSGEQGLLGQVEGRTADDTAYWLAGASTTSRNAVQVVAIDMCSIYACAVRRMLPRAGVRRGLVPRRAPGREDDRRRAPPGGPRQVRAARPVRRPPVRHQEPAGAEPGAPVRRPVHQDRQHPAGGSGRAGITATWIGKEEGDFRHALNLRARVTGSIPGERDVRDRLFAFYDWCAQNDDIPELLSLARTVSRWEDEIVCAVLTGVTNAASESLNRLANSKPAWHTGSATRQTSAGGSASPAPAAAAQITHRNQQRTHAVTGPKPRPG